MAGPLFCTLAQMSLSQWHSHFFRSGIPIRANPLQDDRHLETVAIEFGKFILQLPGAPEEEAQRTVTEDSSANRCKAQVGSIYLLNSANACA